MPTPDDVARWMIKELEESRHEYLNHHSAALGIQEKFGDEFVYINKAGGLAIDMRVLARFRKLTEDTVVWVPHDRPWRKKRPQDEPGKRQVT